MAARRMMLPDYGTVSMKGTQYYRTRVTDQQGRRVSLYARTREELYQKEQEAIQQIENKTYRRSTPTVEEYCEKWLLMQSAQIRMTTLIDYTSKVKNYIIKPLGDMHMGDVTVDDIRLALLAASKKSASVYKSVNVLYKCIFTAAMESKIMQQLHEKIADMNSRYYDLRGKIVKAERRIAILTERGEMWEQYNQYKPIHKQLAKVKPEKREQFEQRHSRELILYDAAARYLKELKDSGEAITPKAWQREIDQLIAGKQTDTLAMKSMREDLKAVERLRKTAEQLSRQERDKSHDRGPER